MLNYEHILKIKDKTFYIITQNAGQNNSFVKTFQMPSYSF